MTQVTKQKGAAASDPSRLARWLTSKLITTIASEKSLNRKRGKAERLRQKEKRRHVVEYFHQIDDGYSDLAIQMLAPLQEQYDIDISVHLVTAEQGANTPEPKLLQQLSHLDAALIAPYYGVNYPAIMSPEDVMRLQDKYATPSDDGLLHNLLQRQAKGDARRRQLGHYSGAMFYYAGEWYWGVDRLYHLEERLMALGAGKCAPTPLALLAPCPDIEIAETKDNGSLTLEFYVSLRSPYTAIAWDRTLKLAQETGVNLIIKPVLPMVMRGVPATRTKGVYIFCDAARQARAQDIPYGNFYDPIGAPVLKCYSLYAWIYEKGYKKDFEQIKSDDILAAFLQAAFVLGINTNTKKGLKRVVQMAGLDWGEAQPHLNDTGWEALLENNRQDMYNFGCWGVPSYRLLDGDGAQVLAVWGQDRLWLVAKRISGLLSG